MVRVIATVTVQSVHNNKPKFIPDSAKIIGGTLALYIGIVFYYLLKLDWALEKYSGAVAEVGEEREKFNLSTIFARESAGVGMLVYVVIFITMWLALRKNAEKLEDVH